MRRRLYYLFPKVSHTEQFVDELLVQRVEIKYIHIIAKDGIDLEKLPEASMMQKNDIVHSAILGAVTGGIIGVVGGIIAHGIIGAPIGGALLATTFGGALLGLWAATMIGMTTPNIHLKAFQKAIDTGQILVLVDIPKQQVKDIKVMVKETHPEATYRGVEPTIPGFP